MKVLFVTSEAYPFAMSGGLADVSGALPKALRKRLVGCRVVMPLYGSVSEELRSKMTFIKSITVSVAWRRQYCGIFEAKVGGVIYYLLDNQYYFKRDGLYGHYDDAERFAFLSRAALDIIPHIDFVPDVIHCNDWQTAMLPVYLDMFYRTSEPYTNIKTVFTIHNIQYQGKYGHELTGDVLGIPSDKEYIVEYEDCVNMMKGGIACADRVTTVSPTYANEIMDPWFAFGLDKILKNQRGKLCGIVNGIDYDVYNPETADITAAPFTSENLAGKKKCKAALQKEMGLPEKPDVPVVAMISRLVDHKGFDLVKHVFEEMANAEAQFIILGSGEWQYETFFHEMSVKYPKKVAFKSGFQPALAKRIYAGADIFLMPSKTEPCGLAQMIAMRYGTVPIVRRTGGLNDTVSDSGDGEGNGFTFQMYNAHDMENAVWRALQGYYERDGWKKLVKRCMECDNSWAKSAGEYIKLYKAITGKTK